MKKLALFACVFALLVCANVVRAQSNAATTPTIDEREAVRLAVLDYVEVSVDHYSLVIGEQYIVETVFHEASHLSPREALGVGEGFIGAAGVKGDMRVTQMRAQREMNAYADVLRNAAVLKLTPARIEWNRRQLAKYTAIRNACGFGRVEQCKWPKR